MHALELAKPIAIPYDDIAAAELSADIASSVLRALSPGGLGLVLVTGVPGLAPLRLASLQHAHAVAHLDADARAALLREQKLGSDVPIPKASSVRKAGAAAAPAPAASNSGSTARVCSVATQLAWSDGDIAAPASGSTDTVRGAVESAGMVLTRVAALVARAVDKAAGTGLEGALRAAGTAKARLIHYYAPGTWRDTTSSSSGSSSGSASGSGSTEDVASIASWQKWHYDYGLLTALMSPQYRVEREETATEAAAVAETARPLVPDDEAEAGVDVEAKVGAGLVVLCSDCTGALQPWLVRIPADAAAVQVGEAAQVLSGGRLTATAHCVTAPASTPSQSATITAACDAGVARLLGNQHRLSRQTMVVFCQPHWQQPLAPLSATAAADTGGTGDVAASAAASEGAVDGEAASVPVRAAVLAASGQVGAGLQSLLPPLASRWEGPEQTFAAFSTATTRAYFGAGAVQDNRR